MQLVCLFQEVIEVVFLARSHLKYIKHGISLRFCLVGFFFGLTSLFLPVFLGSAM